MTRTFIDDTGKLEAHRGVAGLVLLSSGTAITSCPAPPSRTNVAAWVALATHCEASETLRPYARRIRHMLGTAAGIDAP